MVSKSWDEKLIKLSVGFSPHKRDILKFPNKRWVHKSSRDKNIPECIYKEKENSTDRGKINSSERQSRGRSYCYKRALARRWLLRWSKIYLPGAETWDSILILENSTALLVWHCCHNLPGNTYLIYQNQIFHN